LIGDGRIKAVLDPTGPAVGLLPDLNFAIQQVDLEPGDTFFAYTDGVVDARSPEGEPFGEERLSALIIEPAASAADLLANVYDHLKEHISGADRFDDITMLAVRWEPAPTS
jgi:serine phosphatase RsbU (regulator of sigma subunit)